MIVVIPSNRSVNLKNVQPLIDAGARFIIVDDSEGSVAVRHPQFSVYNWNDRRRILGPLDADFPRKNGVSRAFGFYMAWRDSDPGEIIIALDDDCEVYAEDFAARANEVLSANPRPVARSAGTHLNIFDLYDDAPDDLFPRGFPYSARIGYCRAEIGPPCDCNVGFCLGLWRNVFDVNAVDKINGPAHVHPEIGLRHGSVAIAPGNLISVCSMNMQFRRETLPAVIQLPMNVEVMSGWVIDRYGDIWGGFIQKSLMDLRGDALAVGEPMIRHAREGDYLRNIWQEHIPHLLNDEFLGLLAEAMEGVRPGDYLEMVGSLADQFERVSGRGTALFRPYARHLLRTLRAWRQALSREGA